MLPAARAPLASTPRDRTDDARVPRQLLDAAADLVCATGPDGRLTYANAAWQRAMGYGVDEVASLWAVDVVAPEDRPRYRDAVGALVGGELLAGFEAALVAKDGRPMPCRVQAVAEFAVDADAPDDRRCVAIWLTCRDLTEEFAAERASDARLRQVLGSLAGVAVQLDATGRVTFANDALLEATGWAREEVVGADWFEGFVPADAGARPLFDAPARGEGEILTHDGARRLIAWDTVVLRDAAGRPAGTVGVGRDVTDERRQAREGARLARALEAMTDHDELTGLLNARGLRRMTEHAARVAARTRRADAVLCVGVDGLAWINATYGEAAGADALCAVAEALRGGVRDSDVVARVGEDAFVVYAVGTDDAGHGDVVVGRVRSAIAAQNAHARARGRAFDVACLVGVAEREAGDDLDALLARAGAALAAELLTQGGGGGLA